MSEKSAQISLAEAEAMTEAIMEDYREGYARSSQSESSISSATKCGKPLGTKCRIVPEALSKLT